MLPCLTSTLNEMIALKSLAHCGALQYNFHQVLRYLPICLHSHEGEQLLCSPSWIPQLAKGQHVVKCRRAGRDGRDVALFLSNSVCQMDLLKAPWVESVNLNGIL